MSFREEKTCWSWCSTIFLLNVFVGECLQIHVFPIHDSTNDIDLIEFIWQVLHLWHPCSSVTRSPWQHVRLFHVRGQAPPCLAAMLSRSLLVSKRRMKMSVSSWKLSPHRNLQRFVWTRVMWPAPLPIAKTLRWFIIYTSWKLSWNPKMEAWKIMFLFNWVILRWSMIVSLFFCARTWTLDLFSPKEKSACIIYRLDIFTLHETNIGPENGSLEYDRFLLGWPIFRCYVRFREGRHIFLGLLHNQLLTSNHQTSSHWKLGNLNFGLWKDSTSFKQTTCLSRVFSPSGQTGKWVAWNDGLSRTQGTTKETWYDIWID